MRLGETNRQLRDAFAELERSKAQAILELSTPVLQLSQGLLVLPMIGALDLERAQQLDDRLLARGPRAPRARGRDRRHRRAGDRHAVAARCSARSPRSRLLGARVIVTGVSGELAQALVALGVDFVGAGLLRRPAERRRVRRRPPLALERRQLLLERLDGREQVAVLGHALEHVGGREDEPVRVARLGRRPRPPPTSAASRPSAAPARAASRRRPSSCARRSGSSRRTPCPRARSLRHLGDDELAGRGARAAGRRAWANGLVCVVGGRRVERDVDLHALRARGLREALQPELREDLAQRAGRPARTRRSWPAAPGSRSKARIVGARGSVDAAPATVCSSRSARLASHTRVGRSSATQKSIVRPSVRIGIVAVRTQSGRCAGQFFS